MAPLIPAQIPRFLTSPQPQVVKAGDTVTFECLLWVKGQSQTTWSKDGHVISSKTDSRVTCFEGAELRKLQISRVEGPDSGIYVISVENQRGSAQRSMRLNVIVREKINMKTICCSPAAGIVVESVPAFTIPNTRGHEVNDPKGHKVNDPRSQEVTSTRFRRSGGGASRAEVISMANSSPPTFLQHLNDATSVEGSPLELVAQVKGAAEVVWLKNEQLLPNSPYFQYISDRKRGLFKLVIRDPFVQDSGLYVCEAYNGSGASITFATVTIIPSSERYKNSGSTKVKYLKARSKGHESVDTNGIDGDFERTPTVELPTSLRMLNGKVEVSECGSSLILTPHHSKNGSAQVKQPLTLTSAQVKHPLTGQMSPSDECSNMASMTVIPQEVSSQISEHDKIDSCAELQNLAQQAVKGIIASAHHSVEFTQAEVHDPPLQVVNCTEETFHQTETAHAQKSFDDTNDDGRHDSGIIACLDSSDDLSSAEHNSPSPTVEEFNPTTNLNFSRADAEQRLGKCPVVNGPTYLIALLGEQVHIRIKYSGIPQPRVEWTKNGKECGQVEDNSELSSVRIAQVSYEDSGRYVARISNDHGTILHHCFLAVEGPPLPPSTPPSTIFNCQSGTGSISVSWSGSPYDGGSILKAYIVQVSVDNSEWSQLGAVNSLTFTLTNPIPGGIYRFRVACENMYGIGPVSAPSEPLEFPMTLTSAEVEDFEACQGHDFEQTAVVYRDVQIRRGTIQDFYEKGEELGKGRFGTVFNVKLKETGENFAAKIVRCIKVADKVKVRQEIEIMNSLRHAKLLQIMDALENDKELCIITEKINGGELFERVVADDQPLTEFDCIGFMRQICDGVRFMHVKNIIHLDLKPENILCLTHSTYNIKIIDFGLSQKYDSAVPLRVLFGTPEFIAPEIINYEPISPASDMWAVGVITYVLLSGLSPFMGDTDSETFSNITQGIFDFEDESFDPISEDAKDFISKLLIRRQEKRLTATQCLEHKWLAYPEPKKNIVIQTDKLKRFIIRRKWQKTGNAIRALGRMTNLSRKSSEISSQGSHRCDSESKAPDSLNLDVEKVSETDEDDNFAEGTSEHRKRQLQRQQRIDSANS